MKRLSWNYWPKKERLIPPPDPTIPMKAENPVQIFTQEYWSERLRLAKARDEIHKALFVVGIDRWNEICEAHREALENLISANESIIDVCCGWGRLIDIMPRWEGDYLGVDLSEVFIEKAREDYPDREFMVADVREPLPIVSSREHPAYDTAIVAGSRPMVIQSAGQAIWDQMEANIFKVAGRIIFLEYDETITEVEVKQRTM